MLIVFWCLSLFGLLLVLKMEPSVKNDLRLQIRTLQEKNEDLQCEIAKLKRELGREKEDHEIDLQGKDDEIRLLNETLRALGIDIGTSVPLTGDAGNNEAIAADSDQKEIT